MLRNIFALLVLLLAIVASVATVTVDPASKAFKDKHQRYEFILTGLFNFIE